MSINNLPIHILEHIFSYLDNQSMKNAMKVCELWEDIFGNSTNLMNKFVFKMRDSVLDDEHFPNISLKNVNIVRINDPFHAEHILDALNNYRTTVERLNISNCHIDIDILSDIINSVDNLKVLNLDNIVIRLSQAYKFNFRFNLSSLKCLSICKIYVLQCSDYRNVIWPIFYLFGDEKESIEKLSLELRGILDDSIDEKFFTLFINTFPNLKHLIFKINFCCLIDKFFAKNIKLERLEIDSLTDNEDHKEFLLNQKDSLKELKLLQTYDEARDYEEEKALIKFILHKLKLETFYIINEAIILNGKIQEDAVARFLTSE